MTSEDKPLSRQEKREIEKKSAEVSNLYMDAMKHYVRVFGWTSAAKKRLALVRNRKLKYFTLCGRQAIDVFLFHQAGLIDFDGKGFPGVCFCESNNSAFASAHEVLGRTLCWRMDLQDLVEEHSFADQIPFDIINLDFSGTCFPLTDDPFSSTLKSIRAIIELQKRYDFDLFVTFRAQRSHDNEKAIAELKENMEHNFECYSSLREEFEKRTSSPLDQLAEKAYADFLLITIPK